MILAAVLLVAAFILAIKVLKTLFEVAMVAGISAVFYSIMAVSFDYPLELNSVMFFSALGTGLYVGYSILLPLLGLGWDVVKLPFNLAGKLSGKAEELKRSRRLSKIEDTLNRHDEKLGEDEETSKTKEVVLDKVSKNKDSSQD